MWAFAVLLIAFGECFSLISSNHYRDVAQHRLAPPDYGQQQAFIQHVHQPVTQNIKSGISSRNVTFKFDDIDLGNSANRTLKSGNVPFLEFVRYLVVNTTNAGSHGYLNDEDINCANSTPNAILGITPVIPAPSIIRANATTLAEHNLSEFFDFRSLYIKPVNKTTTFARIDINAWEIVDGEAKNVHSLSIGFFYTGHFDMPSFEPARFFPGWGERVNFFEISAADEDGEPLDFCVDNLVLDFYEVEK